MFLMFQVQGSHFICLSSETHLCRSSHFGKIMDLIMATHTHTQTIDFFGLTLQSIKSLYAQGTSSTLLKIMSQIARVKDCKPCIDYPFSESCRWSGIVDVIHPSVSTGAASSASGHKTCWNVRLLVFRRRSFVLEHSVQLVGVTLQSQLWR